MECTIWGAIRHPTAGLLSEPAEGPTNVYAGRTVVSWYDTKTKTRTRSWAASRWRNDVCVDRAAISNWLTL